MRSTAIATFVRAWKNILPTLDPDRAGWAKNIDRLVRSPHPPLEVRTEACRTRREFIGNNIPEVSKLKLFGDLSALDRDGDCQVVFVAGGMMQETEFILDHPGTAVLFAWIVPEG